MKQLLVPGKWDTTSTQMRTQGRVWAQLSPAFITHTEAARHREALVLDGYRKHQAVGTNGEAECASNVRDDWTANSRVLVLSQLPIPRRDGDLCIALEQTVTEPIAHRRIAVHMPSGVEDLGRIKDNAQGRVYRDAIANLSAYVKTLDGPVILTGDWNLNLRRRWVRAYFATHFPDFTPTRLPRRGGTRGRRFIDFSLVRGFTFTEAAQIIPNPVSDHRAVLERLVPKETPVTQRRLTELADVLRAGGCKVVEIDGWKTRSRPESTGGFNPVGVLWHHTGADADGKAYAEWLAKVGRSDLPPPLCQLSVGRDGTWYVIAAGRANHAGQAKASGSVAAGDGNSLYVGVECQNNGTEGWSKAQRDSMVKGGRALGKYLHCSPNAQRGHKETSVTGKWDPGHFDMDAFRADLGAPVVAALPETELSRIRVRLAAIADRRQAAHPIQARSIRAAIKLLPKR